MGKTRNNLYIMKLIARSKQFLYIDNGIKVISVQLNHSEAQIENSFATLPFVNNLEEAKMIISKPVVMNGDMANEFNEMSDDADYGQDDSQYAYEY